MGRLSASLLSLDDRPSIMRGIATAFVENLTLRSAYVFAFYNESSTFQLFKTDRDTMLDSFPLEHPFFRHFNEPIAPTLLRKLPTHCWDDLGPVPFFPDSLIYPIHSFGKLQGVFILSPKRNKKPLSHQDHVLLFTVIHQLHILFDRVAYQEHLAHMQMALDDATKAASVFWLINDYMHELKSPWALLQTAADPKYGAETLEALREHISRHSRRAYKTLTIVNRILARNRERLTVSIDLVEAVQQILEAHSDMKFIAFSHSDSPCLILGDSSDIDILLINLIKNAKEAALTKRDQKNHISITVEQDLETKRVVLSVKDSGCGMSQETIHAILSGTAKTTKHFGSGIGTRAILRIVQEHNAIMSIESKIGEGTIFRVRFPAEG